MFQLPDAENLADAIALLKPEQPLLLIDGVVTTDGGHLVTSFYLDIGLEKAPFRPRYLLKAIEAEYGLEHAANIQLSAPRRFRNYGETLIRDEQEGQARRETKDEESNRTHDKQDREQEEALKLLGMEGASINVSTAGSNTETKTIAFGADSWMYCTAIVPETGHYGKWRESLPQKYDHDSPIRQPRKFALALGAMFADQSGPQGKGADFIHPVGIQSLHDSQFVVHGPVWYTDDVLGFLESRHDDPHFALYPQFLKHSKHRAQREYRFLIRSETPVGGETLHLLITGEMRDTIRPPRSTGKVVFRRVPKGSITTGSLSTETKPTTHTFRQRRRDWQEQISTLRANGQVVGEEKVTREQIITVTSELPADAAPTSSDEDAPPTFAEILQKETRQKRTADAEEDAETISRSRIHMIYPSQIEDVFALEARDNAATFLETVAKPMAALADPETIAGKTLQELARQAASLESNAEAGSACWHSIWPIFNLCERFGDDVVTSVGIEEGKFVAINLKESEAGSGKILVGPNGTFAYVLTHDDKQHFGNGRTQRLIFFPDKAAMNIFEALGWSPMDDDG